jgi:peptide/nickel transport system permease protein
MGMRRLFASVAENEAVRFVVRRLIGVVLVTFVVVFLTFAMIRVMPGDPAVAYAGLEATPQQLEYFRDQLGVNRPFLAQLRTYVTDLSHGDLKESFRTGEPVVDIIRRGAPRTATLAFVSLAIILGVSIPLGIVAGHLTRDGRNRRFEVLFTAVTTLFGGIPQFLKATLLVFVFAVWLRWLPVADNANLGIGTVLPIAAIAIGPTLIFSRFVRLETINVLAQEYIRVAQAKRLPRLRIYVRHVLPNVLTSVLTFSGLLLSGLIGGAVFIETIFNRPGLGSALVQGVREHDYPIVQGVVLLLGVVVVLINAVVDSVLAIVDPRSLHRYG